MKKTYKTILFIILLISISLTIININVLVIEDTKNKKIVFSKQIYPNDEFTMKWMHSVELQPWEEIFRIDKDYKIVLDRTRFKSFGAGVPDYAGNKSEVKNGYVVFSGINSKIDDLQYGISSFAKHTFYFENEEIKLYEIIDDGDPIRIYISQISILEYIF